MDDAKPEMVMTKVPICELGMMLLGHVQQKFGAELRDIANKIAQQQGLKPEDGWQMNPDHGVFMRMVPKMDENGVSAAAGVLAVVP